MLWLQQKFNTTRFYAEIGAGEVVGQDGIKEYVGGYLQAALIHFH
jgi:hypothetical protein